MTGQTGIRSPRLRDREQQVTSGLGVRFFGRHTDTRRNSGSHIACIDESCGRTARGLPTSDLAVRPLDVERTRITLPPITSHTAMWETLRPRHRSASLSFRPWIGAALLTGHRPGESDRWCGAGTSEEASSQDTHASGRSDRYLSYSERFPTFKPGRLPAGPHTGTLASRVPDQSADANPRRGPSCRCRYRAEAATTDSLKVCRHSRPGPPAASKVALSPSVGRQS